MTNRFQPEIDAIVKRHNEAIKFQVGVTEVVLKAKEKSRASVFRRTESGTKKADKSSTPRNCEEIELLKTMILGNSRLFVIHFDVVDTKKKDKSKEKEKDKEKDKVEEHIFDVWYLEITSIIVQKGKFEINYMRRGETLSTILVSPIPAKIAARIVAYAAHALGAGPLIPCLGEPVVSEVVPFDNSQPINHFIRTFPTYCHFYGVPDDKTIPFTFHQYISEQLTDLNCNALSDNEIGFSPLLQALKYDSYFKGLIIANVTRREILCDVADVFKINKNITKLILQNFPELKDEMPYYELATALYTFSKSHSLKWLDLSRCPFGKGFDPLVKAIGNFSDLTYISISGCKLSHQTMSDFWQAMLTNDKASLELKYLDISHNLLENNGNALFSNWIRKFGYKGKLLVLKMAGINLSSQILSDVKGINLRELDISSNKLETIQHIQVLTTFMEDPLRVNLYKLNLSSTSFAAQALDQGQVFLKTFWGKPALKGLQFNLSFNESIGIFLANALDTKYLTHLELTSSNFKEQYLIDLFKLVPTLTGLRNFIVDDILEEKPASSALSEPCYFLARCQSLEYVNLANGLGKEAIVSFFQGMITFAKDCFIEKIDVTNNALGNHGATILAELLSVQKHLKTILLDRNGIAINGWNAIYLALQKPDTLVESISWPAYDFNKFVLSKTDEYSRSEFFKVLTNVQNLLQQRILAKQTTCGLLPSFPEKSIHRRAPKAPPGKSSRPTFVVPASITMGLSKPTVLDGDDVTSSLLAKLNAQVSSNERRINSFQGFRSLEQMSNGFKIPKTWPGTFDMEKDTSLPAWIIVDPFVAIGSRLLPNEEAYYVTDEDIAAKDPSLDDLTTGTSTG